MNDEDRVLELYGSSLWSRISDTAAHQRIVQNQIPYQAALRAMGALLDEHQACRVHILEAAEGFTVRYQQDPHTAEFVVTHIAFSELLALSADLERRRRRTGFGFGSKTNKGGYEDLFRALGFEFDQAGAYSILMDELDDGMLITYQYLRPAEGFNARKRMVILGIDAMNSVLEDAYARREQRKHGILTLLAG